MSTDGEKRRTLKTTERSIELIHTIQNQEGASFMELKERLDIPKSSLYYHLDTLAKHGYIVKDDGQYRIGLRFLDHAEHAKQREPAYETVNRKAQELADRVAEETDFAIEENGRLLVIYHNIGGSAQTDFQIGRYLFMHGTASGKAILSELPKERVDEIIDQWGLPALTENTITEKEALMNDLDRIRERGYGINDEEEREGLRSVSSVIQKPDGSILGALAVDGPTYRLTLDRIHKQTSKTLLNVVDDIESQLR